MGNYSSFEDLRVWQDSMDLTIEIYKVTNAFPKHEIYGLTSQMRRAAVSVPSNIAEGKGHRSDAEFVRFLYYARGSLLELRTQLLIARRLDYIPQDNADKLCLRCTEITRGLNALLNRFREKAA
jgi:four helix bundle protein